MMGMWQGAPRLKIDSIKVDSITKNPIDLTQGTFLIFSKSLIKLTQLEIELSQLKQTRVLYTPQTCLETNSTMVF